MVRWLRIRLGLAALCGAVSGCAVGWSPVAEMGEPLEPSASRNARITEANAPAVVTASDIEPGAGLKPQRLGNPSVAKPVAAEDDGLEKLIVQGRQQGTLSRQDEARLREDMAMCRRSCGGKLSRRFSR